jgi:very-short-patch-repair endonuclease
MHPVIEAVLAEQGVITAAAHPRLKSSLVRLAREGTLANPLPGTYISAGDSSPAGWLRAVTAWSEPAGVLHDRSAAGLWLPTLASPVAFLTHPTLRSRRGVVVCRRSIAQEFVRIASGIRTVSPAYAAVELAAIDDGRAICEALRLRLADTAALGEALSALEATDGQAMRRKVVAACADNPWSYAELKLHRILREAGITGWVANRPIAIRGRLLWPDLRFLGVKLVIEFEGREVHNDPAHFLGDRERQNLFESVGYHVLRFGWEHLDQPDYVVATTRRALRTALTPITTRIAR